MEGRLRGDSRLHRALTFLGSLGAVMLTLMGGFPWTLIAYCGRGLDWLTVKPSICTLDREDQKFWQGVRQSPARTTRDIHSRFRDIDNRLAEIETYYVSNNKQLADEIESLR